MSQKLLRKWLLVGDNGKPVKVSQSQFSKLVVFANWLESDAELQRAADQHEQKCPSCEGRGWNFVHGTTDKKVCSRCNGRGISNRSVGD